MGERAKEEMKTIEDIKAAILVISPDILYQEVHEDDSICLIAKFNSTYYTETAYPTALEISNDEALAMCYERLLFAIKERIEDPEGVGAKIRQAEFEQWVDNIENQRGDKHGELVPTTEQVLERLKTNLTPPK